MSAYLVETNHVLFLVAAAADYDAHRYPAEARKHFAQMLLDENQASVNARYRETDKAPRVTKREANRTRWSKINPVDVIGALDCFEYQACEHAGWQTSDAKAFCDALRKRAGAKLEGYGWEVPAPSAA